MKTSILLFLLLLIETAIAQPNQVAILVTKHSKHVSRPEIP